MFRGSIYFRNLEILNIHSQKDISKPPRPWYSKYCWHILGGVALTAVIIYTITVALAPRRQHVDIENVKIAEVSEAPFMEFVEAEGIVHPITTIQLNAHESGYVDRIVRDEGAMLRQGDTILILRNPELLRTSEQAREQWQKSLRNLREQETQMEQKSIDLQMHALEQRYQMGNLERKLKQTREEYSMGVKSRAELDIAEADYRHEVQKLRLQMQNLHHDSVTTLLRREMIVAARNTAALKWQNTLQRTNDLIVCAPTDGQLGNLNLTLGQQIGGGSKIGEIKVMSEYKIRTSLSEYYVERISVGLPATITQKKDTFDLKISRVVPEVRDRKFDTDLTFTGATPDNIRLGKSYRVRVELGQPEPAVIIPRGDFYQKTGGKWIYRLDADGIARRVEIKLGRQNPEQYEVIGGLNPGDRVIVSGYERLGDIEEIVIK